jgi:hypothetical protein
MAAARRSSDHAQHRTDRELLAEGSPRAKLDPRPFVHADLAAFVALPVTDQERPTRGLEIRLGERKRLADSEAGTPQHDN